MRKLALRKPSLRKLSLGVAAAGALFAATAVPALAQVGVYVGPGGFGFELGAPGYYSPGYGYGVSPGYGYAVGPYYGYEGYYDYAPGWNGYYSGPGWQGWQGRRFVDPRW